MKFLLLVAAVSAAGPGKQGDKCTGESIKDECADGLRCETFPAQQCTDKAQCGKKSSDGKTTITCSDYLATCDATKVLSGCADDFMCATAPAELNNKCVPSETCGKATDGLTPTCSGIGAACDSTKGTGCGKDLSCATAPAAKVDKCVPTAQCDTTVTGDSEKTTCSAIKGAACDPE